MMALIYQKKTFDIFTDFNKKKGSTATAYKTFFRRNLKLLKFIIDVIYVIVSEMIIQSLRYYYKLLYDACFSTYFNVV